MVKVLLSRSTDVYISPYQRAELANHQHVDLFVSAHENSAKNTGASGYEDYRSGGAGTTTKAAHAAFHGIMASFFSKYGIKNRGMKTASYTVLRETDMPAILLEHLFISNASDLHFQTNEAFIRASAVAYANAIRAALKVIGKPNGTVMLDAGHGGKDPGAVNGKEFEKNHMLTLVLLIKKELENESITKPAISKAPANDYSKKIGRVRVDDEVEWRMQTSPVPVANLSKLTDALDGDVWSYVEEKLYEDGTRLQSGVYRKSAGWTYEKVYAIAQKAIDVGANFVTISGYQ